MAYTYTYYPNGICALHIIKTAASNIKLTTLNTAEDGENPLDVMKTLAQTNYIGVNGGFFLSDITSIGGTPRPQQLVNIATQDGNVVGPSWEGTNNGTGTGAVGWNGSQLSCYTNVTSKNNISFSGNPGTWVQGGIALWLGYSQWRTKVDAQKGDKEYLVDEDYLTEGSSRTAMIAQMNTNEVYLIMTTGAPTFAEFRTAVQLYFGINDGAQANNSIQGVMLDGGISSQMRVKDGAYIQNLPLLGNRKLAQLVVLKNT